MKQKLQLLTIVVLCAITQCLFAQNGTADGTYHFGNLGADNSGGTGFKKQGDKFAVSNVAGLDMSDNSLYYNYRGASKGLQADLVIKAEGGSVCRRFTLKDMALYSYVGSYYQKWTYTKFLITLKNESGGTIATHQISTPVDIGSGAIGRLKDIPFTTAWPAAGYAMVARIEFSYIALNEYPEVLGFSNMTIANVSATTLPVNFTPVTAKLQLGRLKVSWATTQEKDNAKFIVQASADGSKWTDLGTVASKAQSGNSATKLEYEFEMPWGNTMLAGLGLFGLLLLPRARNRWMKLGMLAFALTLFFSCAKENGLILNDKAEQSSKGPVYVRVAPLLST